MENPKTPIKSTICTLFSKPELVESERMKELLSGAVVHNIKNFAAGISGHIKLLAYRHAEDRKTIRNMDLAQESCTDIINLASNLLDISKMEDGKLSLQLRGDLFRGDRRNRPEVQPERSL
jgi:signal transduction histidine kinase